MTWRRGLLRVWMFASIMWVIGLAAVMAPEDYAYWHQNPWSEMTKKQYQDCTKDTPWGCDPVIVTMDDCNQRSPGPCCYYWPERGKRLDEVVAEYRHGAISRSVSHFALAAIPPIVLFAIGAASAWVIAGFRIRPHSRRN